MAEYFTAYRIDHILGFFRIWEIPYHSVHGLLGQFVPSLPMSKEEIQSFGLAFSKETMTRPFINDYILNTVFGEHSEEVKETFVKRLHHDIYVMRPEFDREAAFIAVGGVRGSMPWEEFAKMRLPVPSLEKQHQVVRAYQIVADRIAIKRRINDNLVATVTVIYRRMFMRVAGIYPTAPLKQL